MANELASTYKKLHAEQQGQRTTEAIKYIEDQLKSVRQKLRESEEEFNRFSQANQLISIDLQSENLLLRKKEINDDIRKQNEDKKDFEALYARVERFIQDPSSVDTNFYSSKANSQYQSSNNSLVELLLNRDSLLENYTSQHPEVIAISQKITENARKMLMLLKQQIDDTEKRRIDLEGELREVDSLTSLLMEKKLDYDRLKREVESFRDMTALLENKHQEALITKAEKPEEVVIVKPALLSTIPINPPKTAATGAMGIMIGIVLGLVFAFIAETFDTSLGAIEDVEETLGAKVLGVIPHADAKDIIVHLKDKIPKDADESTLKKMVSLISHFAPKTMIAESFRALRTNIQFREDDEKIKTIAITSSSPQEGKTMVSVNLAISLAQAGLKTLLVGADLRKPMLAKVFGLEENPGLTDIILGNYPWTDTVKTITDIIMGRMTVDDVMITPGMDNLNIITCGDILPNPAELIESDRLLSFMKEAEKQYDIVIYDSTPVLSTADAAILGKKVDGVLIVYRVGAVSRGLLKRTSTQLEQVKCNIIGVILNGMKPDISPDFPDYKYYKYYSYYSEEGERKKYQISKSPFSFFRRKGEDRELSGGDLLPSGMERAVPEKKKRKGNLFFRWFLIILALLFLTAGILRQGGILDFANPDREIDVISPNDKKSLNEVVEKDLESYPVIPAPVEHDMQKEDQEPLEEDTVLKPNTIVIKHEDDKSMEEPVYPSELFPFSLYFGSFSTLEKAEKAIEIYSKKDLSPFWVKVKFKDKGSWYRIYAGYFKEIEQAQRYIDENNLTEAEIKNTAYGNLIGIYNADEDLENMIQTIEKLGYSPYILKDQENRSILFVGAFITEEGAMEQEAELRSHGIDNQVVKR